MEAEGVRDQGSGVSKIWSAEDKEGLLSRRRANAIRPYTGDAACNGLEGAGESEVVRVGEQTLRPYEVRFRVIPQQSTIENEMNGVYLEQ
jgi:hypothetical protein